MSIRLIKWLGLISAITLGGTHIAAADYVTGFGIIASALSSAGVIKPQQ